jgi:hypothetical protein
MTSAHFAFAAAIKSSAPQIPLWALMLSTYLLDIVFIFLVAMGFESFAPLSVHGGKLFLAYYSHSFLGAACIALIAGGLAGWVWGKQAGLLIGGVTFSHWVLDLIVHFPDMPILPANFGNFPLLGFGLWQFPVISSLVELTLVLTGIYFYYKSVKNPAAGVVEDKKYARALFAAQVTSSIIMLLFVADIFNLSRFISVVLMFLLVVLCGWLDSRISRPLSFT